MALIKGEVRRWKDDDVTREMFKRINVKIETLDQDVHKLLIEGEAEKALMPNAEMQSLKEVLEITDDLLEDAEGE